MQDFNSFANENAGKKKNNQEKSNEQLNPNLAELISSMAGKYNGASEQELMQAIFKEAEKGRKNGTLSNADIDNFAKMLAPLLDDKKRQKLKVIVEKLKSK